MHVTSETITRIEAASRALLSPLAFDDDAAWRQTAVEAVASVVGAQSGTFAIPGADQVFVASDLPAEVEHLLGDILGPVHEGGHAPEDFVVLEGFFYGLTANRVPVWDMPSSDTILGGQKLAWNNPWYHEVLARYDLADTNGLFLPRDGRSIHLSLHQFRRMPTPGEHLPVLGALYPAFVAGVETLDRLAAHRHALDAVDEPLAAFGPDGQQRHRTPALARLLAADPEAAAVEAALAAFAGRLRALAFARRADAPGVVAPTADVRTAHARYALRAVLLPPSGQAFGEAFLVSVTPQGLPAVLPDAATIRARFGLTKREAEVALLVAEGLSNDAIADRLFVSAHTVRHHVEGAMAKLELTGRGREAVAARLLDGAEVA